MGTRSRGKREQGETYRVGTGSGLTGVVSERVLTPCTSLHPEDAPDFYNIDSRALAPLVGSVGNGRGTRSVSNPRSISSQSHITVSSSTPRILGANTKLILLHQENMTLKQQIQHLWGQVDGITCIIYILHHIHTNQSSIRDLYSHLVFSLSDKVDETRKDIKSLIESISTKFCGPIPGVNPSTPLNLTQADYPRVRHWQPEAWNLMRKGVSRNMDSSVFSNFMEDWYGNPIPAVERGELHRDFYSFFTKIYNHSGTPQNYSNMNLTTREDHQRITEGKFPWLCLCDGHWKFRQTWTHALMKLKQNTLPKLVSARLAAHQEAGEVIELMSSEDNRPRPGPGPRQARVVIDALTSDSSSGSKRGRDNEPAIKSSKKHKAAGPATLFHPAKPKAKGKQTIRFAQVSAPQPPHSITILTKRT